MRTETDDSIVLKPDMKKWTHFLACGFGSGLMPKAPGTWGTVAALPLAYGLLLLGPVAQIIAVIMASGFGIWVCGKTADDLKVHDHQSIVWDEFCGLWIALMLTPIEHFIWIAPLAFVLFRFFDIVKPGPIGWLDRTQKGGWGIMADDLLAGLAALCIIQALLFLFL